MTGTEIQLAMLLGPGLAAENTHTGRLAVNIQPLSAEARGREASWEDGFTSGEEAESGQGWPSGARIQAIPAADSPALVYLLGPPLVTSNIPEGSGCPSPVPRGQSACAGTKSPRCQDGC